MRLPLALCLTVLLVAGVRAQSVTAGPCPPAEQHNSSHNWFSGRQASACEVRSTTLAAPAHLDVKGFNGGIEVLGEDRSDIALEATVSVQAATAEQAQATLHEITLSTTPTIEAHGPETSGARGPQWQVNFKLHVPHQLAARLQTFNGPITLADLAGTVDAQTTNGPLRLRDLAGNITAVTKNGPIDITLAGRQWSGPGLNAQTTNGGIALTAAPDYSAHLVAQTTHGGIDLALPTTLHGSPTGDHVETDLGQGGAPLRLQTTNGGIKIQGN